ncbi:unnamed protein product [Polarella glacialis]|uniref:Peptidase S49 domain-containing protein n=1 Tax=Polarella glacialis TaxID=89957 RepID=A0A813L8T0_POLGL|nr:unnamed protein product [Polarella glacialis]
MIAMQLEVVVGGGVYLAQVADKRFFAANGRKPQKVLTKIVEKLSGASGDALEDRRLQVRRLNDEVVAMRCSLVQQESGVAASKLLKEDFRQRRQLAAWEGVLRDLDLTPKELQTVGAAYSSFYKKEMARREEVEDLRSAWLLAVMKAGGLSAVLGRWRLAREQERQLDLQSQMLSALSKDLPEAKFAQIAEALARSEDPLVLPTNTSEASALGHARQHVYVLSFDGDLGASGVQQLQQEVTAVLAFVQTSASSSQDRPVEVVLRVKSPGGTVTGYGLAAAQLMRLRQHGIRLVVCVDEIAASGGYLMACCADKILCSPFAAIGSIGVISGIPNVAERLEREGFKFVETTAGKWKRTVTPFTTPTEQDLAKAKLDTLKVYEQFSSFVKANRPALDLEVVATGEVWFGSDALHRGLVDEIMTSTQYLLNAVEARGCEVLALQLSTKPQGLLGLLQGSLSDGGPKTNFGSSLGLSSGWPMGSAEPRMEVSSPADKAWSIEEGGLLSDWST